MNNLKIERLKGFEDYYLIDSLGNIISLPRLSNNKNQFSKGYQVLGTKINKEGYINVTVCANNKNKTLLLHRLVAETFIPNPNNLPCVNHIDGNKLNNSIENLEWVTHKQNSKHAYDNNVNDFKTKCLNNLLKINEETMYIKIYVEKNGVLNEFNNSNEASKFIGCHKDSLTRAIKHKHKCCGFNVRGFKKHDIANEESLNK